MAMSGAGNPDLRTPNMDRLGREGAVFTRTYTSCPVCCPARSSMMTGLFPNKTGVWKNDVRMSEDVSCIAEILRDAGYATGHIGKWHLDGSHGREDGYDYVPPERHRGFTYWAGFEHGHRYWNARYFTDGPEPIRFPEGTYEPDGETDLALEFMERHHEEPWFLDLSWGPPHFPLDQAKPEDRARHDPATMQLRSNVPEGFHEEAREAYANYYAMIENLDWNLGRLLDKLDELGLAEDTIVVFTSDHGDMLLSHGQHFKRRPQQESALVPFLVRYPGAIPAGQRIDALASLVDEVPTLLDLMGVAGPAMDGVSHAGRLHSGDPSQEPDSIYMHGSFFGCRDWDPGLHARSPWRAVVTERYKAAYLKLGDDSMCLVQLYDLGRDPYEMQNLAQSAAHGEVRAAMDQRLREWISRTEDRAFDGLQMRAPRADPFDEALDKGA